MVPNSLPRRSPRTASPSDLHSSAVVDTRSHGHLQKQHHESPTKLPLGRPLSRLHTRKKENTRKQFPKGTAFCYFGASSFYKEGEKMKRLAMFAAAITLLVATQAMAFITVIVVREPGGGKWTVIQNKDQYTLTGMNGKFLGYRGQPEEASALFTEIVKREMPRAMVEIDINEKTGTIAATVIVNGYFGSDHYYYVLKRLDD